MPKEMQNTRNDEFTLNIDLTPTMLGAAGIPIPKSMQGRDMAPLYLHSKTESEKVRSSWRKEFYYEWFHSPSPLREFLPASLALVRKNLKYVLWPEFGHEELFELEKDPYEEENVFNASLQSSPDFLKEIKGRFQQLKEIAESGVKI